MIPLLLLACIVCSKVFKKTTPNGKVTIYLEKRDFVDRQNETDPIDGIVVVDGDYLKGKKIFAQLSTIYRYGREEDEVMGLKFSKEFILARGQIAPATSNPAENLTPVQERLIKKFPENSFPFTFKFPVNAPSSVTLQPGEFSTGKSLGVFYAVKCLVGENDDDDDEARTNKKTSVSLIVKKLQESLNTKSTHSPSSVVSKYFSFGSGRLNLEVTLDKDVYYHGEVIEIHVSITNTSRRSVKDIKCYVAQHCEMTMINARYSKYVASLETKDGCPVIPGTSFAKKFFLVPTASINKNKFGIALDGYIKGESANLASSTLREEGKSATDALGIIVSYSVQVKLNCGTLGGELVTDVPFKLIRPPPGSEEEAKMVSLKNQDSIDKSYYEKVCFANVEEALEGNTVLKDFARQKTIEIEE